MNKLVVGNNAGYENVGVAASVWYEIVGYGSRNEDAEEEKGVVINVVFGGFFCSFFFGFGKTIDVRPLMRTGCTVHPLPILPNFEFRGGLFKSNVWSLLLIRHGGIFLYRVLVRWRTIF